MPWDPYNADPSGAALRQRATEFRRRFNEDENQSYQALLRATPAVGLFGPLRMMSEPNSAFGPLPDYGWEGLKQALHEAGGRVSQSGGQFGPVPSSADIGGYNPDAYPVASAMNLRTQQIGQPNNPESVSAIVRATGDEGGFVGSRRRSRVIRRGTAQSRVKVAGQRGGEYEGTR